MRNKVILLLRNRYLIALILILFALFWVWWISGLRVANDFSFISNDWLKLQFGLPSAWNERGAEGLGEYGVFILWSYPINFIFGIFALFGMNFQIWERILVILFILLGSFSIWRFLTSFNLSEKAKFIGSLFYLINTYPILLIDGGQISIAIAYGIFPYVYLNVYQAIHGSLKEKVLAGIIVSILGYFDIRFLLVLFLLLLIRLCFELSAFWKWFKTAGIIGFVVVLLNAYWLIAYINIPIDKDVFSSFTKISASLTNIGHPVLLISPHWYKNVFGQITPLRFEFILIPFIAFLAPILRRKDKQVAFWFLTALTSIFLAKGTADPFPNFYLFLHENIPLFSFFRDSTKFFFLVALSYAVLISITSEELFKRRYLKIFPLIFITLYLLYLIRPVLLNQMTGTFSIQPNEKEFQSLSIILKDDKEFGRVFWIPTTAPLSYSDLNHPIVEAARVFNRTPFVYGVKGGYEIFNFLREAPYMGEIFDISSISYIAYPYLNMNREKLSLDEVKYYNTFLNQLDNLSWIQKRVGGSEVPLLKTKSHQDKIFLAENSWIYFGSDEIFIEATKSAESRLSENAVIFAEREPESGPLISKLNGVKIVLGRKSIIDLIASFIPKSQIIFPSKKLSVTPDASGWWKNDGSDFIHWRDFLQSKYGIDNKDFDLGGGWAIGEGNLISNFQIPNSKKGDILFVRAMESSRSGNLSFYQDNELIGSINTKVEDGTVRWFKVGFLQKTSDLTIKTKGDINVINAMSVVNLQDLAVYQQNAANIAKRITDFKPENIEDNMAIINNQKINQTKYKVIISGLIHPKMVVFSSTFHPQWKLNGESSIPVYGFLNGFRVSKNGEYILEFEPQKYVEWGLIVSSLSCTAIALYLLRHRKKGPI